MFLFSILHSCICPATDRYSPCSPLNATLDLVARTQQEHIYFALDSKFERRASSEIVDYYYKPNSTRSVKDMIRILYF